MDYLRKTYTVFDYDYVAYAGNSLTTAKSHVRGGGSIQVWTAGKIAYSLRFDQKSRTWKKFS